MSQIVKSFVQQIIKQKQVILYINNAKNSGGIFQCTNQFDRFYIHLILTIFQGKVVEYSACFRIWWAADR